MSFFCCYNWFKNSNKSNINNKNIKTPLFYHDIPNVDDEKRIEQNFFINEQEAKIMIETYNKYALNPVVYNGQKCFYYVSQSNMEGIALFSTFYISKRSNANMKFAKYNLKYETLIAISALKPSSEEIDKINMIVESCKYYTNSMIE